MIIWLDSCSLLCGVTVNWLAHNRINVEGMVKNNLRGIMAWVHLSYTVLPSESSPIARLGQNWLPCLAMALQSFRQWSFPTLPGRDRSGAIFHAKHLLCFTQHHTRCPQDQQSSALNTLQLELLLALGSNRFKEWLVDGSFTLICPAWAEEQESQ